MGQARSLPSEIHGASLIRYDSSLRGCIDVFSTVEAAAAAHVCQHIKLAAAVQIAGQTRDAGRSNAARK